jgi:hypothetical protein
METGNYGQQCNFSDFYSASVRPFSWKVKNARNPQMAFKNFKHLMEHLEMSDHMQEDYIYS